MLTVIKTEDEQGLACFLIKVGSRAGDLPVKKYTLQGLVDELSRHRDRSAGDIYFITERRKDDSQN